MSSFERNSRICLVPSALLAFDAYDNGLAVYSAAHVVVELLDIDADMDKIVLT